MDLYDFIADRGTGESIKEPVRTITSGRRNVDIDARSMDALKDENRHLLDQVKELESSVALLKDQRAYLELCLREKEEALATIMADAKTSEQRLLSEKFLAENDLKAALSETAPVRAEREALLVRVKELERSAAALKDQRDGLELRFRDKENEFAAFVAKAKAPEQTIQGLHNKNELLLSEKLSIENKLNAALIDASSMRAEKGTLLECVKELEDSVALLKAQRDALEAGLREKEKEFSAFVLETKAPEQAARNLNDDSEQLLSEKLRIENDLKTALNEAEAICAEREALLDQVKELVSSAVALKKERDDMELRLRGKENDLAALAADVHTAKQKIDVLNNKNEQTQAEKLFVESKLKESAEKFSGYALKVKIGGLVASLLAVTVVAAFLMKGEHAGTDSRQAPEAETKKTAAVAIKPGPEMEKQTVRTKKAATNVVWPKKPLKLDMEGVSVSVSAIGTDRLKNFKVSFSDNGTANNYCLVTIETRNGFISEDFLKAPRIAFIDKDNISIETGAAGAEIKTVDIATSKQKKGKKRAVRLRSVVSVSRDLVPSQIVIKNLNEDAPKIIIFSP